MEPKPINRFPVAEQRYGYHALQDDEVDFHQPSLLPEGRGVLFVLHRKDQTFDTIVLFDGQRRHELLRHEGTALFSPVYSSSGYTLYEREPPNKGIWALPFSLKDLRTNGPPFLLLPGAGSFSLSQNGTVVYIDAEEAIKSRPALVDPDGSELWVHPGDAELITACSLAPRNDRMVLSVGEQGTRDLWMIDRRGARSRLTSLEPQ